MKKNRKNNEIKTVNKSLEHREELKFIQSLDKSRSKRNVIKKFGSFKENNEKKDNNNIINDTRSYDNKNNLKKLNTKVNNSNNFNKNNNISPTNTKINNNKKENNNENNKNKVDVKKRKK